MKARMRLERQYSRLIADYFGRLIITLTKSRAAVTEYRAIIDRESSTLRDHLAALMEAAATLGVRDGGALIEAEIFGTVKNSAEFSFDWTKPNYDAVEWALDSVGELIRGINETTIRAVQADVAEWIENGEPLGALTNRLAEKYAFSRSRAESIAATEVTRAYAEGNVRAWRESGVVEAVQIATANDERVCPICAPLGGLQFSPDGDALPASVAQQEAQGVQARLGQPFTHPGGAGAAAQFSGRQFALPPFHPRCRCSVVPVVMMRPSTPATPPAAPTQPTLLQAATQAEAVPATPAARQIRPNGAPVSEALSYGKRGKYAKTYDEVIAAIDGVHGDGDLPIIPIKTRGQMRAYGRYRYRNTRTGGGVQHVPVDIQMRGSAEHKETTLAHEIGHFIDHLLFDGDRTNFDEGLRSAIENSEAIKKLRTMRASKTTISVEIPWQGGTRIATVSRQHLDYLGSDVEIWARAYAQYISQRSGNAKMIEQIAEQAADLIYGMKQWAPEDFAPIATEIDRIFAAKGWITR